jgi:6-phosphogluconolactonase
MANPNRITRRKLLKAVALSLASTLPGTKLFAAPAPAPKRILVGSDTNDGILSFAWDPATGSLTPEGIAAKISQSTWIALSPAISPATSPDKRYLYVACELDVFEGKPTGAVGSFKLEAGKLTPISLVPSEGKGTCHLNIDRSGRSVIAVNYAGGTATSFLSTNGKLTEAWTEKYEGSGPVRDRQEMAHAHFASLSPDNRFVYINDLGSDKIHIYKLDAATAKLTPAGTYSAKPGDGPRTLHFHPNGKIAYCMNELNSTVTVLQWSASDGSLKPIQTVSLLPDGEVPKTASVTNTGCDTVLTRDGRFAYFANRGHDFLMSFHVDPATGKLTEFPANPRTSCGGKTPRNFTLDPTERWMLVANQNSSNLSVFPRDPKTGILSNEGKNTPAATPMCIVFV